MTESSTSDRLSDQDLADFRLVLDDLTFALDQRTAAVRDGADFHGDDATFGVRDGVRLERFADVTIHGRLPQQAAAVEQARSRMDEGTFGTCQICSGMIPVARLEVIPWADSCVGCAQSTR